MYNPPKPKKEEFSLGRISLKKAQNFTYSAAAMACLTVGAAFFMTLRTLQERERDVNKAAARRQRGAQRVVVIGAGAGGAALAGLMTATAPEVQVTVIEKEKKQTFRALVPHAHVGHRSYDLNTTGAYDSLRSPATWNITRDANLVMGHVVRVDTDAKEVLVKPAAGSNSSTTGKHTASVKGAQEAPSQPTESVKKSWFQENMPFHLFSSTAVVSEGEGDGATRPDGLVAYPYDVLVLACGAERGVTGPLRRLFPLEQLDRYRVAVNPGVTRDNLSQLYAGNVLHVRVPPARLFQLLEQQRLRRAAGDKDADLTCVPALDAMDTLTHSGAMAATSEFIESSRATTLLSALGRVVPQSEPWTGATHLGGPATPADFSFFADCHAARPLDAVFVSTTNLIWKYLHYFHKLNRCQFITVTADREPLGPAVPPIVNTTVRALWSSWQAAVTRPSSSGEDADMSSMLPADVAEALQRRFHFLPSTYVTAVDYITHDVTLYNASAGVYLKVPYQLLVLDLPLVAPSFIAASGLDRATSAKVHATSSSGWSPRGWLSRRAADPPASVTSTEGRTAAAAFTTHRRATPPDPLIDEDSFPDIDPFTLQHRRLADVFALGDVAGVPSVKSYGATLTQVPVVAHNVQQVLFNQRQEARRGERQEARDTSPAPPPARREANARYDGYTSFHVAMTPWRALWPECVYTDAFTSALSPPAKTATTMVSGAAAETSPDEAVGYLRHVDHHVYDNLSWRGLRGFLNGFFIQSSLYENAYFFLFTRGTWYPPRWFKAVRFDEADGTMRSLGIL